MNRLFRKSLLFLSVLIPAGLGAAERPAASFLLYAEPNTRLYSMGQIFSSLDYKDVFFHPWSPNIGTKSCVSLSHWPGVLEGSAYDFAGLALSLERWGARGAVNVSYLRYDAGQETFEEAGGATRTVRLEEDTLLSIGYGTDLSRDVTAGAAAKYLGSTLAEDYHAGTMLFDIGAAYHTLDYAHTVGAALRNIGSPLTYYRVAETLPTELSAGYTARIDAWDHWIVAGAGADMVLQGGRQSYSAGFTYYPVESYLSFSGGARYSGTVMSYGAGLGIRYEGLVCDIGYGISGTKISDDAQLRFSLSWAWDEIYAGSRNERRVRERWPW